MSIRSRDATQLKQHRANRIVRRKQRAATVADYVAAKATGTQVSDTASGFDYKPAATLAPDAGRFTFYDPPGSLTNPKTDRQT